MKTSWTALPLSDCAKFVDYRGKTPPKREEGIRLITAKNVKMGFIQRAPEEFIDPTVYDDWMTRGIPQLGDVLFTTEAPLGNVAQLDTEETVVIGQRLITLQTNRDKVDPTFLKYALTSPAVQAEIHKRATGATVLGIKASLLKQVPIPLPPIKEQQGIVAVLDEAFEGLARARAHAEANLQNARELAAASVDAIFDRLPDSTPADELQAFCTERGITYGVIKLGEHDPEGVPCLRTSNVKPLLIDTEGMKWILPELSDEYRRTILEGGEVLVNVRGTLGGVATVPENMAGWNISREVAMVPVDREKLDPDFASFFISTRKAQRWLTGVVKGAAYKGINLMDLRLLKIPVPTLESQRKIIEEIKDLRERMEAAEEACEKKIEDLDDLRQSLLQKAFAGELT